MKPPQIKPVRSVAVLAVLTIVIILLSAGYLLLSLRARELRHAQQETVSLTQMLMEQTEKNFVSADLILQGVQERLASPFGRQLALGSTPVQLLLSARASGLKAISSLFLVDENGTLVNSSREVAIAPMALADRQYFKVFAQGRPDFAYLDKPVRNRIDNAWTLYLARRVTAQDGSFRGVLVAAINIVDFEKNFGTVQLDYVRPINVYMSDGTLVASVPHRDSEISRLAPELGSHNLPTKPKQIVSIRQLDTANGTVNHYVGKLSEFPLLLGVTDIEQQSLAPWREFAIPLASGAILISVFTALVASYLIGKLQRKDALTVALNSANVRYQHTVDSVMDAIVAVDEKMSILLFNPAAESMFGHRAKDALGKHLDILIPERLRQRHVGHMNSFSGSDPVMPRTVVPVRPIIGLRSDGSEFPIESTFSKSMVDGNIQMTAVLRDATAKRKAEQELRDANSQLRQLSNSLTQVREQERARISRELHDDLGQQLTGLKLSLSWLGNRIKDGRETAAQNVDEMRHQLDTAIASVRRIAAELRPRVLDDLDFTEALTWQTREFTRHSGLEVTLNLEAGAQVKDNEAATALFRIVQEALTNVVRYAQATQVHIGLTQRDGCIELSVHDDGIGFDSSLRSSGVGLVGMRERCTSIGGEFGIVSQADRGTTIVVTVPLAYLQAKETTT
ncbi:MAG: PAS domain S-box protein [Rhodoferax sp.]|nr:PAS domain S-box protein [Rhodoferax sp.]